MSTPTWSDTCPKCPHILNLHFQFSGTSKQARREDAGCMLCDCVLSRDQLPPHPDFDDSGDAATERRLVADEMAAGRISSPREIRAMKRIDGSREPVVILQRKGHSQA